MNKILARIIGGLKAMRMTFQAGRTWRTGGVGGLTRYPYESQVGDGRGNAIIMACLRWAGRAFPEAPLRVRQQTAGGDLDPVPDHPLTEILRNPTYDPRTGASAYSGLLLWQATIMDWMLGNAYWLKVRSRAQRVVQLWWLPSWQVDPRWDDQRPDVFITHYEYRPGGRAIPLEYAPSEIVHFRNGIDPYNVRKGLGPLGSLMREIFTDDEAANFTASLLRNMGVPGLVIRPGDPETTLTPEQFEATKEAAIARTTGDRRGEPLVFGQSVAVDTFGYNPQQMLLKDIRRIPEERVTAVLGIPAVVAGVGAGLDRSIYNNVAEARESAYESFLIPTQRLFAAELTNQLLPEFGDPKRLVIDFDLSEVRVLQEDMNARADRLNKQLLAGGITLNDYLSDLGKEPIPSGDVRYLPINITVTPEDRLLPPEPAPGTLPSESAPAGDAVGQPEGAGDEGSSSSPQTRALRTLAYGAAWTPETKVPADVPAAIRRLRTRLQTPLEREVGAYLAGARERVLAALRNELKAADDADVFDFGDEAARLAELLNPHYLRALEGTAGLTRSALGVSFTLDDPLTRAYLREAGAKIVDITETTRQAVAVALQLGQAEGEGYSGLAARLRDMTEWSANRARTIARTELAEATVKASWHSYAASGVVEGVQLFDGDDFDEPCAQRNGQIVTLEEARGIGLLHPNCTLATAPVTRMPKSNGNGHVQKDELRALVEA